MEVSPASGGGGAPFIPLLFLLFDPPLLVHVYESCINFLGFLLYYLFNAHLTGTTGNKTGRVLAIALPIVAAILATIVICSCLWRRKRKTPGRSSLPGKSLVQSS